MVAIKEAKCKREDLFPKPGTPSCLDSNDKEHHPCYKLLHRAARELIKKHFEEENIDRDELLQEYINDLYCFLQDKHMKACGGESISLNIALQNYNNLIRKFCDWKKNQASHKPGPTDPLSRIGIPLVEQRVRYYRKRIGDVLRNMGRRAEAPPLEAGCVCFTYGGTDLPFLSDIIFHKNRGQIAAGFAPSLRDEAFWHGEEPVKNSNGTHEGPTEADLDGLCGEFFHHVSAILGKDHLCSLDALMLSLPSVYTYFAPPPMARLELDVPEDNDRSDILEEGALPNQGPLRTGRALGVGHALAEVWLEKNASTLHEVAQDLNATDRILIWCLCQGVSVKQTAAQIGQKSTGRIGYKTDKAMQALAKALENKGLSLKPDLPQLSEGNGLAELEQFQQCCANGILEVIVSVQQRAGFGLNTEGTK